MGIFEIDFYSNCNYGATSKVVPGEAKYKRFGIKYWDGPFGLWDDYQGLVDTCWKVRPRGTVVCGLYPSFWREKEWAVGSTSAPLAGKRSNSRSTHLYLRSPLVLSFHHPPHWSTCMQLEKNKYLQKLKRTTVCASNFFSVLNIYINLFYYIIYIPLIISIKKIRHVITIWG